MARPVGSCRSPGPERKHQPHGGSFTARGRTVGKVGKGAWEDTTADLKLHKQPRVLRGLWSPSPG